MSTITLPNIRVGSDLQVRVRLKDDGVAIDWSTLQNIKACIYSDAQRALAGRCGFSIDEEDSTLLVCTYAANKPQYLGVNRIVISAKYMGETKTYDKPAFNFVRWTADQEGEAITIDDPDVDVEIEVEDVSSSLLDQAIAAALAAAAAAEHAAHLIPNQVLLDAEAATVAANAAADAANAAGITSAQVSIADDEPGTPSAEVSLANKVLSIIFHHLKGNTGDAAGFGTITATVDDVVGDPSVTVTVSGPDTAKNFTFAFHGLRGIQGVPGVANAKYKSVDTLPTASAATMDFIYLTPSGTTGVYNMSYTEQDGSTYRWQDLGTTAIQLSDYATKAEVSQLEAKVDLDLHGEGAVNKSYSWSAGYVNGSGNVVSSTASQFCQPILFKAGETLVYKTASNYADAVVKVANNNPVSVGSTGIAMAVLISALNTNEEYSYTFTEDTYVVISVLAADYTLTVTARQSNSVDERISDLESDINDLEQIVDITRTPSSNLLDLTQITDGYYWWIYGQSESSTLFYSAHIPVTPGETYTMQRTVGGGREIRMMRMIVGYKADNTLLTGGYFENVNSYVAPNGCSYVIVTGYEEDKTRDLAFVKSANVIDYEPYGENVSVELKDGIVTEGTIANGAVTGGKIADNSVGVQKLAIVTYVKSKNLLDPSLIVTGKWIGATGNTENVVSDFGYYDYIEVDAETDYHISNSSNTALCDRTDAYIAFYDSSKVFISSVDSKQTDITTPSGCAYVRISVRFSMTTQAQMETGTQRTSYEEYFAPYPVINPEYISFPDNGVTTPKIADGAVTQNKIAEGVSLPASPRIFNSIRLSQNGLTAGNSLVSDTYLWMSKNLVISASFNGLTESLMVGYGLNGSNGEWVEVTATEMKTRYGSSGTVNQTFSHGLTLGTRTKVVISKNVTPETVAVATVRIIDDYGNIFKQNVTWWGSSMGKPFAKNGNTSASVDVLLSVFVRDIKKRIWMFGDSYFNYDNNARWPYYPINWGFDNFLLNGRGGENATEALADFNYLLTFGGVPSFAVWCMGMNSGADSAGAVNPTWLSITQAFIAKCEEKGIEPILATIPSVPTEIHTKLNEWVRASGYRYIDFADAVESSTPGDYLWRGWGTANALLSNDEVHPSAHGAAELATRVFQDFPEITICID